VNAVDGGRRPFRGAGWQVAQAVRDGDPAASEVVAETYRHHGEIECPGVMRDGQGYGTMWW
jgi:hypothetical protein